MNYVLVALVAVLFSVPLIIIGRFIYVAWSDDRYLKKMKESEDDWMT